MPVEANTEVKMIPEFSPRYDVYPIGANSRRIDFLPVPEGGPKKTARKGLSTFQDKDGT
jgi:hypothetical protein